MLSLVMAVMLPLATAAQPLKLRVDFSRTNGIVRPLHGLNKGTLALGGMIDVAPQVRELAPPLTRLHDCQWPYPEVVDIHAVFRNAGADPKDPSSYDWALTDAYLAAIQPTGAGIVYRLGESIEHGPVKRFVHPPADPGRWAAVCLGIIRHYNEGWSKGYHYNIRYWEIWNEPENRPAMWSGSDEDYLKLYETAARAIKQHYPDLKVGGPALGYYGQFEAGRFVPSEFVTNFLVRCRRDVVPLDFFSWHCYTADPAELNTRARAIRQFLNGKGFEKTESHLNEWNYLPGNSWEAFSKSATPVLRRGFYERMSGAEGAAFVATALSELEDAPVDVCNFYHGETGAFGLFDEYGAPNRVFYALRAFSQLSRLGNRVVTEGAVPGKLGLLAAKDNEDGKAAVLIGNFHCEQGLFELALAGLPRATEYSIWVTDRVRAFEKASQGTLGPGGKLVLELPSSGVAMVELR